MFGFDSILKPYRIIGIVLISMLFLKKHIVVDIYDKLLLFLFFIGIVLALKTSIFDLKPLDMTVNNIVHILFFFFVCLSIKNISLDIDDVKRIFKYFIFGALINSIYVGAKLFLFSGISIAQQNGFWRDPATFGVTLVITIMYFLISLSNKTLSRKIKSIYGIIIIYLIFILFASEVEQDFLY